MRFRLESNKVAPLAALLFLLGALLLFAPLVLGPRSQSGAPPQVPPRPSPTWRPLPTRLSTEPTIVPSTDPLQLHQAMLRGDLDEAAAMWQTLLVADPEPGTDLLQAGARLALLQGRPVIAADRAWQAIGASPTDALSWSLLGIVLRHQGSSREAEQALAIAQELDPQLEPQLFGDRWRLALATGSALTLAELAEEYQLRHPDSGWLPYYQAEALIAADFPLDAIQLLVPVLAAEPTSPALLWYTLGRAYLARGGHREASTALEAAASRTYQGDNSLDMISDDPLRDLNRALGLSYLGSERCREAEMIFGRLRDSEPAVATLVREAIVCQTPTPTLTPWIPKQIGTVTPRP